MGKRLPGACITREQWLLRETRVVARLRLEGVSPDETVWRARADNLFQYPTERSLGNIARVCNKRIDALRSETLVRVIAQGEPEAAAQANLYAMMCTYPLVRHFMLEEIAPRFANLDYSFTPMDMNAYFSRLAAAFDNFANAAESTTAKLKQVLRRCLVECGMLDGAGANTLVPVFPDASVREAIVSKGDARALRAFGCREAG